MALVDLPTTAEQTESAKNKLLVGLDSSASTLTKSFVTLLAKVLAGAVMTLHKYAGFILLQLFARTATYEEITVLGNTISPLIERGRRAGVGDPNEAQPSFLSVRAHVQTAAGELLPGRAFVAESGVVYETVGTTVITGSTITFTVVSVSDPDGGDGSGGIADLATGELQFVQPHPNLRRDVEVLGLVTPGIPAELEDDYRDRVIEAEEAPPQGGSYSDYRIWAQGVPGVLAAYPRSGDAPMEVDVFIEGGDAPDFIPSGGLLALVADRINQGQEDGGLGLRPVNDAVNVLPIERIEIDITINGFDGTPEERAELAEAWDDRLRQLRPFIQGLDPLPRRDVISRSDLGGIAHEVASSLGRTFSSIQPSLNDEDFERLFLGAGQKAKLGTVTHGD